MRAFSPSAMRTISLFLCLTTIVLLTGCSGGGQDLGGDGTGDALASAGASFALAALLEGAGLPLGGTIGAGVAGIIMALILGGGPDPNQQVLDDLNQIKQTLDDIEVELAVLATQLAAIETELAIYTRDIEKTIVTGGLDPYVISIDGLWDEYLLLKKPDGTWDTDNTHLTGLATSILDDNSGVFHQLVGIHDGLTGEGNVSGNIFAAVAKDAAAHTNGGGDHLKGYLLLENYFGAMLRAQTRGATLMVEALRHRDGAAPASVPKDFVGDAVTFMAWYQAHIEDQVEVFLRATESYVTQTADPTSGFEEFVPDAKHIFWRADLTSAWLSRRHRPSDDSPVGQHLQVYRVIGGPQRVEQYGTGWDIPISPYLTAHYRRMLYNPSGTDPLYDVPTYAKANNHAYTDLTVKPYVQFLTPQAQDGTAKQYGAISHAESILVGKYYATYPTELGTYPVYFHLGDIPYYRTNNTIMSWRDVAGNKVTRADGTGILYGCCVDTQQPPADVMGKWDLRVSQDDQGGLYDADSKMTGQDDKVTHDGVPLWTKLYTYAYPTAKYDDRTGNDLSGHFNKEYSLEGHYYWAGDATTNVRAHTQAELDWSIAYNGHPSHRWAGLIYWFQGPGTAGHHSIEIDSYTHSGHKTVNTSAGIPLDPGHTCYIAFGSRVYVDYDGTSANYDDWHHWSGSVTTTVNDFWFTIE